MTKYEFLMLASPGVTGDEMGGLEKQFEKLIKDSKGTLVSFDRWGKSRLAYPVKKNDYGVYYMARFEMDKPQVFFKEMKLLLDVKYNDLIMRTVTVKIDAKKTFTDFRPETVEDIPTRNVDQFLRENKMEGLISKGSEKSAKAAPASEAPAQEAAPVAEEVVSESQEVASADAAPSKDEEA